MEREAERAGHPDAEPLVVLVTTPPGDAARVLARALVEGRLAACVHIVGPSLSVYRWQGQVAEETESLLIVKTTAARLETLELWLAEHHPYDVPECVALSPMRVEPAYLAWLLGECREES